MIRLAPLLLLLTGCDSSFADPSREYAEPVAAVATPHPTRIHRPSGLGAVDTPLQDIHGTPVGVSCATCHAGPGEDAIATDQGNPEQVHGSIELQHGALACAACHDPEDRRLLRLADGRSLEMGEAMQLCAQCHGPQARDYQHGAHGGMSGYWDLRQGERLRNHCVDCHAPHSPRPAPVQPAPRALDRVSGTAEEAH